MCGEEHGGSGRGRTGPRPTAGLHPRQPGDDEPEGGVGSAARAPRALLLPAPVRPQHQVQRRPAARAVVRVLPALDDPHHVRRRHGRHRLRLWVDDVEPDRLAGGGWCLLVGAFFVTVLRILWFFPWPGRGDVAPVRRPSLLTFAPTWSRSVSEGSRMFRYLARTPTRGRFSRVTAPTSTSVRSARSNDFWSARLSGSRPSAPSSFARPPQ
jgi:hypothetical protein